MTVITNPRPPTHVLWSVIALSSCWQNFHEHRAVKRGQWDVSSERQPRKTRHAYMEQLPLTSSTMTFVEIIQSFSKDFAQKALFKTLNCSGHPFPAAMWSLLLQWSLSLKREGGCQLFQYTVQCWYILLQSSQSLKGKGGCQPALICRPRENN